jgi:protein-L-isoaspartate(D-aspartate) O-methyltransferase
LIFTEFLYNLGNMPIGDLNSLVNHLIDEGVLKTPLIIDAFKSIDRAKFVPENMKPFVYVDEALSIGQGQTISQPYTVAFMLELLEPQPREKILDIGSGSGWQTALLARIVGGPPAGGGRVFAMEVVPELCKFGKANVKNFNFIEKGIVEWKCQDASGGLPEEAPFDRIIAAAALNGEIPQEWKDQLKIGGRMVVPVKDSIWLFVKKGEDDFETTEYPGFVFVPFVK